MVKEEHCLSRDSNGCDDRNDVPRTICYIVVCDGNDCRNTKQPVGMVK